MTFWTTKHSEVKFRDVAIVLFLALFFFGIMLYRSLAERRMYRRVSTRSTVSNVQVALECYKLTFGKYPPPNDSDHSLYYYLCTDTSAKPDSSNGGLKATDNKEGTFLEPLDSYVASIGGRKVLVDSWRNPLHYSLETSPDGKQTMTLYSFGPNGIDEQGGGDDINP